MDGSDEDLQQSLKGLNVLLVEDITDLQVLIGATLGRAGARVDIAGSGGDGMTKALTTRHDVILMDLLMPDMDGYEVARRLRDHGCCEPIVAITACAMDHDRQRCLASGFTDYISKPIRSSDLIQRLAIYRA